MSLLPASSGPTVPPSAPRMQPAQIPGSSGFGAPQPIPRDTHFNNLRHPDVFNNAGSFPLSAFDTLQGSTQGMNPHPSFLNDQALSDVIWPGTNPTALPDGSSQYISSNQSFQTACTCPTCVAHRFTAEPVQFGGGQPAPAPAGQDAMTSSGPASSSSTSRRHPAASLVLAPALDAYASMHYPSTIDAGLIGFTQPTAETGYARRSNGRRRVHSVRNPHRARDVPFVRVKDRVKWVRRDLMEMTLWFNWSLDAEVEAYEPWDELPPHLASPAEGVPPLGTEPAPDIPPPARRSG